MLTNDNKRKIIAGMEEEEEEIRAISLGHC